MIRSAIINLVHALKLSILYAIIRALTLLQYENCFTCAEGESCEAYRMKLLPLEQKISPTGRD